MNRLPVQSSQIHAIGYDAAKQILEIEFARRGDPKEQGSTYQYANVPAEIHRQLMAAESKGNYFSTHIKPKKLIYPFTKVHPKT